MADLLETSENGVTTLTLNRPERLNALSPAMTEGLKEALERLSTDRDCGAIVITGAGRGWCAGGDVKTMESRGRDQTVEDRAEGLRRAHQLPLLLRTMPKDRHRRDQRPGRRRRARPGARLRSAHRRQIGAVRHRLCPHRLFRRLRRLVEPDPAGRHRQGARALFHRRHHRRRGGGPARHRQPRRRRRRTAGRDDGIGAAHRRRAAHRAWLHEAQPARRRDRAVPDRARARSRASGALRLHRGSQGGGRRLQRKAPPRIQGPIIGGHNQGR